MTIRVYSAYQDTDVEADNWGLGLRVWSFRVQGLGLLAPLNDSGLCRTAFEGGELSCCSGGEYATIGHSHSTSWAE